MAQEIHLVSGWYWAEHQDYLVGNKLGFEAFSQALQTALTDGKAPAVGQYDSIERISDAVLFTNDDSFNPEEDAYTLYGTQAGLILLHAAVETVLNEHETLVSLPPFKGLRLLSDQFFEENPYVLPTPPSRGHDYLLTAMFFIILVTFLLGCSQILRWSWNGLF